MAATPAQIRAGIVTALQNALGTTGVQISAYRLKAPTDQCIQVIGTVVQYDQAMQRGIDYWTFRVQAFAGSPVSQIAQTTLDAWKTPTGSTSVKAAIEADITLGGIVASARVEQASEDTIYLNDRGTAEMLGCIFDVFVVNTGH